MIKTMFWLAVMWCGLGNVMMIGYIIVDAIVICIKLDKIKGEGSSKEFLNMLEDSGKTTVYLHNFLMNYPNPNEFKFLMIDKLTVSTIIMIIIDWPHMMKLWRLAIHIPVLQKNEEP